MGVSVEGADGALNYAKSKVLEAYCDGKIAKHLRGALDYQFIANPAFDSSQWPSSFSAMRLQLRVSRRKRFLRSAVVGTRNVALIRTGRHAGMRTGKRWK